MKYLAIIFALLASPAFAQVTDVADPGIIQDDRQSLPIPSALPKSETFVLTFTREELAGLQQMLSPALCDARLQAAGNAAYFADKITKALQAQQTPAAQPLN